MKKERQRCFLCRKIVESTVPPCKCDEIFCSVHRYPWTHACSFDFKKQHKEKILIDNPQIKNEKIIKL
jgi:hypothetical protein